MQTPVCTTGMQNYIMAITVIIIDANSAHIFVEVCDTKITRNVYTYM